MQECEGPLVATGPQESPPAPTGWATLFFHHDRAPINNWCFLFGLLPSSGLLGVLLLLCCNDRSKRVVNRRGAALPNRSRPPWNGKKSFLLGLCPSYFITLASFVPSALDFKSCCISKNSPSKTRNELNIAKCNTQHNSLLFYYVCIQSWWMCIICRCSMLYII